MERIGSLRNAIEATSVRPKNTLLFRLALNGEAFALLNLGLLGWDRSGKVSLSILNILAESLPGCGYSLTETGINKTGQAYGSVNSREAIVHLLLGARKCGDALCFLLLFSGPTVKPGPEAQDLLGLYESIKGILKKRLQAEILAHANELDVSPIWDEHFRDGRSSGSSRNL